MRSWKFSPSGGALILFVFLFIYFFFLFQDFSLSQDFFLLRKGNLTHIYIYFVIIKFLYFNIFTYIYRQGKLYIAWYFVKCRSSRICQRKYHGKMLLFRWEERILLSFLTPINVLSRSNYSYLSSFISLSSFSSFSSSSSLNRNSTTENQS